MSILEPITTIPTFDDSAINPSIVYVPFFEGSCSPISLSCTFICPPEYIVELGVITPVSNPIATVIGLKIDPGSNISVIGLFFTSALLLAFG